MEAAYRFKPVPELQYNLAQCYERLGQLDAAAAAYQRYLDGKPNADDRAEVAERLQHMRERLAKMKEGAPPPPPPVEKLVLKTVVVYRALPPPPGRAARAAALASGLLAVGGLAVGVTFAILAARDASSVTGDGSLTSMVPFAGSPSSTQAAGHTDVVVSWVGFGVAAVGAAGAVGLYLWGRKIDREAPKLTFLPSLGPHDVGLALGGRF